MPSSPPVEHHYADLGDVLLHYVTAGKGPPVVLIHGWPQTWYEWRHTIAALSDRYTVIAPDMRGLGDSSRPLTGYDKATIANDIWKVVSGTLGHKRFRLVGHDWGGPTAFALASAHPEAIEKLAIVDVVIPGDGGDFSQGGFRWHHQFHITPDLPEALTQGRERIYLSWFYRTFSFRPDAITDADLDEYVRTYSQPGAMRAGFSLYRAMRDDAATNAKLMASGFKLPMPILAVGGDNGYPGTFGRGRRHEPEQSLKRWGANVTGATIPNCGHFVPEEQPELFNRMLLDFLA